MTRKLIYSVLFFLGLQVGAQAQSMNAYVNAADEAVERKDYYSAVEYYKKALEFDSTRTDLVYNLAQSARLFNAYSTAISAYNTVLESPQAMEYPEATFWLAQTLQIYGNYDEAITNYNLYLSEYRVDDSFLTEKAEVEIIASEWALEEFNNSDNTITLTQLDAAVNTPYSEFGATIKDNVLTYSSMRYQEENTKHKPPRLVSKIIEKENGGMPEELSGDINDASFSVGNSTFNNDKSKIFYTVCNYITDSDLRCDIYSRSLEGDSTYINPQKLNINIESDSITTTQPSFGIEPMTNRKFLIFSSDREGGKGGLDLWKSYFNEDGTLTDPVNLDDINTKGNEITPFYHNASGILYFSTDGRRAFGGYDVFSVDYNGNDFGDVLNLGMPINSSFNDIYYSLSDDEMKAHLSSNRIGSYYIDQQQEACCYDIYKASFENVTIELEVLTFDGLLQDSLTGVTVELIDPVTGDILQTITNDRGIDHTFELKRGRNYLIVSKKEGFNPDTISLSTRGINTSEKIIKKVFLTTDRLLLDITTFDKNTLDPLAGTLVEIYDITGERTLVESATNPLSNDFRFYIDKDKSYEIIASKEGYISAITNLDTRLPMSSQIITRKLYLETGFEEFLPLALFFDNDRPDRRSVDLYTAKSYSDVYIPYMDRKETFKRRYSRRVAPSERAQVQDAVEQFFENEVKGGYTQLNGFLDILYDFLKQGKSANLSIKGYTSPLAASRYNLALGQRRVSSVKNEFRRYKNGILMPYIENGRLSVTDISFGEELVPEGVSDRRSDTPNSIYSVVASRERRVEIVKIKIN
ncbi:MAG: hypothetical protein HKN68_13000 [Saprospiraceae bacterium]|nr:hypothetical protein [Saprospiraceae bacterium]